MQPQNDETPPEVDETPNRGDAKDVNSTTPPEVKGKARQGKKPRNRKLATKKPGKELTGNQWQNTPRQNLFMELWTNPDVQTFGNAYQSAIKAGYSEYYARKLASPDTLNQWIGEYRKRVFYTDEHIRQGIQRLAKRADNSKSPDDTRLKAYELLAKVSGLIDGRGNVTVNVVQPILGGASDEGTERVVIDQTLAQE